MDTPDAIAHPDRVQHGSAGPSADDMGKDGVDAIEVRLGEWVMKYWLPPVLGPESAIPTVPVS